MIVEQFCSLMPNPYKVHGCMDPTAEASTRGKQHNRFIHTAHASEGAGIRIAGSLQPRGKEIIAAIWTGHSCHKRTINHLVRRKLRARGLRSQTKRVYASRGLQAGRLCA